MSMHDRSRTCLTASAMRDVGTRGHDAASQLKGAIAKC